MGNKFEEITLENLDNYPDLKMLFESMADIGIPVEDGIRVYNEKRQYIEDLGHFYPDIEIVSIDAITPDALRRIVKDGFEPK